MKPPEAADIRSVDARLKRIYGEPEGKDRDPVSQLVITILSQATTDTQTARSFASLQRRFATWDRVRDAPVSEIAVQIKGSGLSRQKAPRIKSALKYITMERGKIELNFLRRLPDEQAYHWLTHIKGVGSKTASIVLLFSFRRPLFPVDTHIRRIAGRLGWVPQDASADKAHAILQPLIPRNAHYRLHVNLIHFGREVCIARRPRCEVCPLTDLCRYYKRRV